jgi:hypothetical protein
LATTIEPTEETLAKADLFARELAAVLDKCNEAGVSDEELLPGAIEAHKDIMRHAAQLASQGLFPVTFLEQAIKLKAFIGMIVSRARGT